MVKHAISMIQTKGWKSMFQNIRVRICGDSFLYEKWKKSRAAQNKTYQMSHKPIVHIYVENGEPAKLIQTLTSIQNQSYPMVTWSMMDERQTEDCYVMFLCAGDVLEADAIEAMVCELQMADAVYCDYDVKYQKPAFLPDYSIDYLRSLPYISRGLLLHSRYLNKKDKEHADDLCYLLSLRLFELQADIRHICDVLLHEEHASKVTDRKKEIVQNHLKRMDLTAQVTQLENYFHVNYQGYQDGISIIIPNKDHREDLKTCIEAIEACENVNYEILIVENGSSSNEIFTYYDELKKNLHVRILNWTNGFHFSAIHNDAVPQAKYEHILLMNNDVQILQKDFLRRMLGYFKRREVGAVGVKLLYPDHTIQHDGVLLDICGYPAHAFLKQSENFPGYGFRAQAQNNMSAVTAACMMTTKTAYAKVGGMDENLAVAFNDIDYCLRLREAGYLIVQDPSLIGIHYESKSRGLDQQDEKKKERFDAEYAYFKERWIPYGNHDPYYNPNLSRNRTDFRIKEVNL